MTEEEFEEFLKMLEERAANRTQEEIEEIERVNGFFEEYDRRFPEGIPFQMPCTIEEIEEALRTGKPFEEWEEYKDWYSDEPVPDHIVI